MQYYVMTEEGKRHYADEVNEHCYCAGCKLVRGAEATFDGIWYRIAGRKCYFHEIMDYMEPKEGDVEWE